MMRWFERWNAKRVVVLGLTPAMVGLGLDSAISHFAGKPMGHAGQLIPLVYSALAAGALGVFALRRFSSSRFRLGLRVVGGLAAGVGALGTWFHLLPLYRELAKEEHLSFGIIEGALSLAPPVGAPAAFVAVGAMLWLVASPRVQIDLRGADKSQVLEWPTPLRPVEPAAEPPRRAGGASS